MAKKIKVNGATIKAKVKATRNALFGDEKYTGTEPVWDTERARAMQGEEFDHHMRKSLNYYNYFFTQKDLKKYSSILILTKKNQNHIIQCRCFSMIEIHLIWQLNMLMIMDLNMMLI